MKSDRYMVRPTPIGAGRAKGEQLSNDDKNGNGWSTGGELSDQEKIREAEEKRSREQAEREHRERLERERRESERDEG
jgi:hypothetical protein